MDPFTLGLISTGIGSAFQTTLGFGQTIAGALMKPKRPTYTIPAEIRNALALRQMNLNAPMAGYNQSRADISSRQASTNAAARNVRDASQVAALAAAGQAQATQGDTRLAVANAQDYQVRLSGLERAQNTMARYRDKAFDLNEYEPFQDKARTKAALIQGGLTNIMGGMNNAARGFGQMAGMQAYRDYLNNATAIIEATDVI